jgi:hypothetical protein
MILIKKTIVITSAILVRLTMSQRARLGIPFKLPVWKILLKSYVRNGKTEVLKLLVATQKMTN